MRCTPRRGVESYFSTGLYKPAKEASISQSESTRAIYSNSISIMDTYLKDDPRFIPLSSMATLLVLNEYMVTNTEGFEGLSVQF